MVQINLLPPTAKKKRKSKVGLKIKLGPVVFILGAVLTVIMVVWAILGLRLSTKERQLTQLDGKLQSLNSTLQKLDQLKEKKERLAQKLEFMRAELKREVFWAKNLNQLSNLVPPGIWLKDIVLYTEEEEHLDKYERLDINGSVVSLRGEEMIDLIGKFMTALKKDETFSKQFSKIELISSQRKKDKSKKVEVMDFKLYCQFR